MEDFAKATHAPIGYLFLSEPPVERIPIPDFRTVENRRIGHPSPDLLETIYLCQQRQEWYRDYLRSLREEPLPFIGSATPESDVVQTAAEIRHALGFEIEERRQCPTWTEALHRFIEQADRLGVLVMVNGVVGSNNHRKLNPDEFRGFAISDDLAPLVFFRPFASWHIASGSPDGVPVGRERIHSSQESTLRFGFLPGILGMVDREQYGRQRLQHRKGR